MGQFIISLLWCNLKLFVYYCPMNFYRILIVKRFDYRRISSYILRNISILNIMDYVMEICLFEFSLKLESLIMNWIRSTNWISCIILLMSLCTHWDVKCILGKIWFPMWRLDMNKCQTKNGNLSLRYINYAKRPQRGIFDNYYVLLSTRLIRTSF